VELGAVVVVPGGEECAGTPFAAGPEVRLQAPEVFEGPRPLYSSRMAILGNDILQSWMERVRKLRVESLWLTCGPRHGSVTSSALAEFVRQGVERLLVIKLKSYAEMDLADLLRFHCERRNPVTEAQDVRGQLGVSLLDHLALQTTGEKHRSSGAFGDCGRTPYQFSGYAKRILSAKERQELVGDGLTGGCAMRPLGTQIRDNVWMGEGVKLADSARLIGPAYIGAHSNVRAGATVGPFASVERDCVVDCGTTVERSTVLPHTYLAPGLLIRDALVDGEYLEHLGWGTVADLLPAGLGRRIQPCEPLKEPSGETTSDVFSRGDGALAWDFAPSSAAARPWIQVRL
jgi:hypothetical protein